MKNALPNFILNLNADDWFLLFVLSADTETYFTVEIFVIKVKLP